MRVCAPLGFGSPYLWYGVTFLRRSGGWVGVLIGLLIVAAVACGGETVSGAPLKIGLVMNYSSGSSEVYRDRQRGFELAVKHVNEGGGVFGLPVEVVIGDTTMDPDVAVDVARRLVEDEGVHAIVGPNASANALPIAEKVTGPAGISTVSFSASSPKLSTASDNDFLFRTLLSDKAQGPMLARVTRERGFDNVGVMYVNDAWGQGLAEAFVSAWDGQIRSVAFERGQTTFMPELRESASGGAQALVVIAFETEAEIILREAIDGGIYDQFTFGDAAKRLGLVKSVGGTHLGGMYGTGPGTAPDNDSSAAWEAAYAAEYGELPVRTYVKETYDATVAIALAAQAAGSVEGAAIRDQLRAVGSGPGEVVIAGPEGIADGLRILGEGGEVDYEGAASTLDWDENGDIQRGYVGVWRYTADERIEELDAILFE